MSMLGNLGRNPRRTALIGGAAAGVVVVAVAAVLIVQRINSPTSTPSESGYTPAIIIDVPPGRVDLGRGIPIKVRAEDSKGIDQIIILEDGQQAWSAQSALS